MVVDSSALVAVLLAEAGYERLREALVEAANALVPAPVLVEAGMVMLSRTGSGGLTDLDDLLARSDAQVLPFSEAHARAAVVAFDRYGKGRACGGAELRRLHGLRGVEGGRGAAALHWRRLRQDRRGAMGRVMSADHPPYACLFGDVCQPCA